ncbi:uncharacterized protein LOC141907674 [Tubulanus polymorphus]|uniref:uncharacterized protein LOC141907674 n=1 Tax=Tubulanus polymorphus TaxID=672921 RepID=UPI003DA5E979
MTAISTHDDAIEVIEVTENCHQCLSEVSMPFYAAFIQASHKDGDDNQTQEKSASKAVPKAVPKTKKERRIARVVMIVAALMLVVSVLLVGITLSMSGHIDEMVRKVNGLHTTARTSFKYEDSSPDTTNSSSGG